MAELSVAILGLNRTTASVGLALKRYQSNGGKHSFTITAYDSVQDNVRHAKKIKAVDKTESTPEKAVEGADLVVFGVSYDIAEQTYKDIRLKLRDGVVVLDLSPLKQPSLKWAKSYLTSDQHLIGMTPVVNPDYLFDAKETIEEAKEDLFDNSAILLTPSASCVKEAVDLAFNFASILGSKPRFLDPIEHDMLLAQTVQLPRVLGTLLFYDLTNQPNWDDLRWLTNPDFGALTRPLFDVHPDALRDEFYNNREALGRVLDHYIDTLKEFREALQEDTDHTVEGVTVSASESYENWVNSRFNADWDASSYGAETKPDTGMLHGLLGGKLADKLIGKEDDK